jgi:hypothetical protein
MPKAAISFNVPPRLWGAFKAQTDALFLSRAPFLDYMVRRELVYLREDLGNRRMSTRAKRHVAGAMKRMGPVSVNIDVESATAEALRDATEAHNMVRDAFMSRLIVFLRSTNTLLDYLDVPLTARGTETGEVLEEMPSSPLRAMAAVRDDPFFYVRFHVERNHECGIYVVRLPPSADWAACYIGDEEIPGTAVYRRQAKLADKLLAELSDDPPIKTSRKSRRTPK